MENKLLGVLVPILITVVSFALGAYSTWRGFADGRRRLAYYAQTYLSKSGFTTLYKGQESLNYNLRSFDGGKNWYAVEETVTGGVKILGLSEEVYPGLLKHLEAMDHLVSYVEKYGAIRLLNREGVRLLERVGFTVTRDET